MPKGVYPRRVKRHAITQPLDESYRLIPLTRNQNAIVDAADFTWLSQWNWYALWDSDTRSYRAMREENGKAVIMARLIANPHPENEVDHWNHDTLDHRRANLRECTHAENSRNHRQRASISGFIGVYPDSRPGKWQAQIRFNGRLHTVGRFDNPEDAARARDKRAKELHGKFAALNFPSLPQDISE
jgi:hypothetical protein